jgi:hypothetical protein
VFALSAKADGEQRDGQHKFASSVQELLIVCSSHGIVFGQQFICISFSQHAEDFPLVPHGGCFPGKSHHWGYNAEGVN